MRPKMMNRCLNLSQDSVSHTPSSSLQTLASTLSLRSAKRRNMTHLDLAYRSAVFGTKLILNKSEPSRKYQLIKHTVTACLDADFFDGKERHDNLELELQSELDWQEDMIPANIERKANNVNLPFSLRIIKKKKQWQDEIRKAGESTSSSVKKAFSSMVFILRELQSYTLHMRQLLFYQDLQDIIVRVRSEMNSSFVWLFQQVFSKTPTLMVYVMILLANYSIHSMSNNFPTTSTSPPPAAMEAVTMSNTKFDSSSIKTFSSNSGGRTTSIGGNNGGGGRFRQVASGTDGNDKFDRFVSFLSGDVSQLNTGEESISGQGKEEEWESWNSIVNEADQMHGVIGDDGLDHETKMTFVSPVTTSIEAEDAEDYYRTEVVYQTGLLQEPDNPLLLANYAQFLYLVARDYDRAEDYFKRASMIEPKDAEALNKYASFLWQVRKDLWAAEETYLEAISADPNNSFYAANYAHFLWNTGGEDTCFPLDSPESVFFDDV
ncbi:putative tetratricopeptide-like helical domain superfamily [Helianthus debilis subsp. tardiflorus]